VLLTEGSERRALDLAAYDQAPHEYANGTRRFVFDREIYAAPTVRAALRSAQHGKCCFCESKISHVGADDVEHFRPKAGFRQQRRDPLARPGYYWLAYEWTNLYLACRDCNTRHKQNLFPLEQPAARARDHHEASLCEQEQPTFVDPCDAQVDPETLIGFREGEPYAIDASLRASSTIRELELGRRELMELRADLVKVLRVLLESVLAFREGRLRGPAAPTLVLEAASILAERTEARAQFTAVTRHFLRDRLGQDLRFPLTTAELVGYAHGRPLPTDPA
jgi:uncharacterized protein (TIGR02646 family)